MLLVSGGNGNLARSVIANLLRMTDPGNILVTTRDPQSDNARELAARGVTVRHGDFDVPGNAWPAAFAGATRALLISTYADNSERLRQNLAGLEAVKAAGVGHVLYTSFLGAGPDARAEHSQLRPLADRTGNRRLGPRLYDPAPCALCRDPGQRPRRDAGDRRATPFARHASRAPSSPATISASPRPPCSPGMGRKTASSTRRWNAPTPATRWPRRSRAASASRSATSRFRPRTGPPT